jgi:hypothetical protein
VKWPAIVWIVLVALGWLFTLAKHGELKEGRHDIGVHTAACLLSAWLLWCGDFFQ